jgi:hypothetical protein
MMAHKWSRPDLVRETLGGFRSSGQPHLQRAAKIFLERRKAGTLPKPRDPHHKICKFHGHFYTKHRFTL